MKRIIVNVTQSMINKGFRDYYGTGCGVLCLDCPVALAVNKALNTKSKVYEKKMYIGRTHTISIKNPKKVIKFIRLWDQCKLPKKSFKPISFAILVPDMLAPPKTNNHAHKTTHN